MKGRNKRIRKSVARGLMTIFLLIGVYVVISGVYGKQPVLNLPHIPVPITKAGAISMQKYKLSEIEVQNQLALVNEDYPIEAGFHTNLKPAYRVVPISTSDIQMNQPALTAVEKLFAAAKEAGYKKYLLNSGYRSHKEQQRLYEMAEDKSYVQQPGYSEHQTGYALDIAYLGLTGDEMDVAPQGKWLMQNAHQYGFILRYPKNKTEITKISYEPWHYRYIGLPHAYYCAQNDLCLEEYLEFLRTEGSYTITIDGTTYTVYYAEEEKGMIRLPQKGVYTVSADNMGGYIVTIKE